MRRIRVPKHVRDLRICPTCCTQRRTRKLRLAERKTFDGIKCYNCGFEKRPGFNKVVFSKLKYNGG